VIQLPNPVLRYDVSEFLGPEWIAQRKWDGVRFAVQYDMYGKPKGGITKTGKEFSFAPTVCEKRVPPNSLIDGELLGTEYNWESALRALAEEDASSAWVAFGIVDPSLSFFEQEEKLIRWGFTPTESYTVSAAWESCNELGWEGIVVRKLSEPTVAFKVKFRQETDVVVVRDKMFVLDGPRPILLGSLTAKNGKYRVRHEGLAKSGKLRAANIIGPARTNCSAEQLKEIRR